MPHPSDARQPGAAPPPSSLAVCALTGSCAPTDVIGAHPMRLRVVPVELPADAASVGVTAEAAAAACVGLPQWAAVSERVNASVPSRGPVPRAPCDLFTPASWMARIASRTTSRSAGRPSEPRGCRLLIPPTDDSLLFGCDFPTQRAVPVTKLSGLTHHRAQAKQVVSLGGGGIAAREAQHGTRDDRTVWTVYAVGRGDKERFASLCDFVANRTVQDGLITLVRGKDPAEEDAFSGIIDHVGAAAAAAATKDDTGGDGNDATL
jgi:hypothetical protein